MLQAKEGVKCFCAMEVVYYNQRDTTSRYTQQEAQRDRLCTQQVSSKAFLMDNKLGKALSRVNEVEGKRKVGQSGKSSSSSVLLTLWFRQFNEAQPRQGREYHIIFCLLQLLYTHTRKSGREMTQLKYNGCTCHQARFPGWGEGVRPLRGHCPLAMGFTHLQGIKRSNDVGVVDDSILSNRFLATGLQCFRMRFSYSGLNMFNLCVILLLRHVCLSIYVSLWIVCGSTK